MSLTSPRLSVSVDRAVTPVVHLEGSLDRGTTPLLRTEAAHVLLDRPRDIVLECSRLTEVDAAGIRAILDIWRHLPRPGEVLVVGARRDMRRLLEATGVDRQVVVVGPAEDDEDQLLVS